MTQCDHWREVKTLLQHTIMLQTADSAEDSGKGLVMLISHPEINLNLAQKQHLLSGLQYFLFVSMLKNIKYKDIELEVLKLSYLDR